MKNIVLVALALTVVLGACKKRTQEHGLGAVLSNTWYLDGTMYKADSVYVGGGQRLSGVSSSPVGHFGLAFSTFPTASGVYRISNSLSAGSLTTAISVATSTHEYSTKGYEGDVNVTLNNGKIIVTVPEIWLKSVPFANDSVRFNGCLLQK